MSNDGFNEWAALFVRNYAEDPPGVAGVAAPAAANPFAGIGLVGLDAVPSVAPVPRPDPPEYRLLTPAARELLRSVDAGGVPAFVTHNLRQIALENGIEIAAQWSPNRIIDAIRQKIGLGRVEGADGG